MNTIKWQRKFYGEIFDNGMCMIVDHQRHNNEKYELLNVFVVGLMFNFTNKIKVMMKRK